MPKRGIIARIKKIKSDEDKIAVEDALKHLYDCEFKKLDCSLNSLTGNLGLKPNQIAQVISKLESMSLVTLFNGKINLTEHGRDYATRVVRIHRLWERYLAENTSVSENEWHVIAEEREHETTDEVAEWLSARLGNPLVDPHGDPIPNKSGEILSKDGVTLNNLGEEKYARIIHIEDEPKEVYAQLTAFGLYPGMQIKILENTKDKVRFLADGHECLLAPVLAANLTVQEIDKKEIVTENFDNLTALEIDEVATVVGISNAMRGQQRRRMLDFGIVPGTTIYTRLKSLKGDPSAYEVRGALIALRKNQSDLIHIKKLKAS
ncbi:MAG: DtxR family transcriptional regulator Mn-dependent transcriptional regulator [Ignavibacteria bacterium]|nr:MAG: DtxR family transcriptional regulator Mn-dependent transcriptional regulator [Ignavibacteria bacterium]KAF0160399.1 MAG: DtxR family transcriptional regulator Mn-dependent transcriptional regulator [Ignavibacteria bacterium]